jgi:hypothetical protein
MIIGTLQFQPAPAPERPSSRLWRFDQRVSDKLELKRGQRSEARRLRREMTEFCYARGMNVQASPSPTGRQGSQRHRDGSVRRLCRQRAFQDRIPRALENRFWIPASENNPDAGQLLIRQQSGGG